MIYRAGTASELVVYGSSRMKIYGFTVLKFSKYSLGSENFVYITTHWGLSQSRLSHDTNNFLRIEKLKKKF
jgi:hypothetical protein